MNEEAALQLVGRILSDNEPMPLQLQISMGWVIHSALYSVTQQRGLGKAIKARSAYIAGKFAGVILREHPDVDLNTSADIPVEDFIAMALPAMSDETPVIVDTTVSDCWLCVSALQLSTRHPWLGDEQKKRITQIGRQIEKEIARKYPDAAELLVMGWDERYDYTEGN